MWRNVFLTLLCLSAASALAQEKESAPTKCLPPEHFRELGRLQDFLPQASAYLAQNPEDPRGPKIAMDILMVATAMKNSEAIAEARRYLLLHYIDSLPADYVIRTAKPDELRTFLTSTFTSSKIELTQSTLDQFYRSIDRCMFIHGPELANDELWAQAALCAPDPIIASNCHGQVKDLSSDSAKVLTIVRIKNLTEREKFVQLQELKDFATARAWQTHLYSYALSKADQADPTVQGVFAENLLADGKFDTALPVLVKLTTSSPDAKLRFYRGWAEAATDQIPAARKTLEQLAKEQPKDAWSQSAAKLAAALSTHASNVKQHVSCLDEIYHDLREHPPEKIEMDAQWGETQEDQYDASVGIDFVNHSIELLVGKMGKPLVGYSNGPDGSSFFVEGERRIYRYQKTSAFPSLDLTLTPTADGRNTFRCGFLFTSDTQGSKNTIARLLNSPLFSSADARRNFVQSQLTRGAIPAPVVSRNGTRCCRWLIPQAGSPDLQSVEICLANNGHLASAAFSDAGRIYNIRYGAHDDQPLNKHEWPDLPITEAKEMGAGEMFRLLGAASELFWPKENAEPKTAAKPNGKSNAIQR